ncbi:MAG: flavodoxin domain-containing protein [Candidatus Omnitrophica bacterium]|jgi:flavorubredoxin|nr:flavodoxin domain-containing protein [Candidatus Omnitrophota bacterium]MDD5079402.1 flavodoxin domain-containing protein [Candidatus Omnitrophota bacterium]
MKPQEIKKGIYWVGVVDWNVRNFHGHTYTTKRGTTYNSYLIVDDKIALIDTVLPAFAPEFIARIKEVIDPAKIDYVIANHVETDHSGAMPELMKLCPGAKVLGTQKCKEGLYKHYYADWDFQAVKSGDGIKLGSRRLVFLEAPMLHWPDSMFTYIPEDEMLMPNDAFGQHYATSARFNDQVDQSVLMEEARKYYANILWPLSGLVLRKIEEVQKMNIPIKMIAPSHGLIWRSDPAQIIKAYLGWAGQKPSAKTVIVYETMWGSTGKMAKAISRGLIDSGMEVQLFDINQADRTEVITEMLDARGFLFGSSTHDNDMLPQISGFLELVKGFKAKNRIAGVFGSFGWAGGAVKEIEDVVKLSGIELAVPSISAKFVPDTDELNACYEFGRSFAGKI